MSSFREQLQRKHRALRPTETTVRYADGRQELHRNGRVEPLESGAYGFIVDTAPDTTPCCVHSDWLFVGSQDTVAVDLVATYGITHLLSVGVAAPIDVPGLHRRLFVSCLDVPETDLLAILTSTNAFIDACRHSGGRVLVHCNAGVSRSVSVVIGWLMQAERCGFDEALATVRSQRPCSRPNDGFAKQLREMQF